MPVRLHATVSIVNCLMNVLDDLHVLYVAGQNEIQVKMILT